MFKRNPKLPIKKVTLSKTTILERIIELIYKVSIFRKSAKTIINKVQQKIKVRYPVQQLKEFAIENQVLSYKKFVYRNYTFCICFVYVFKNSVIQFRTFYKDCFLQ